MKDYTFDEIINEHERGSEEPAELQKSKEKLEQNCQPMSDGFRHLKEEVLPEANTTIEKERRQTSYRLNEHERGSEELAELQKSKEKLEQNCQSMSDGFRHLKEVLPEANTTIEEERLQMSYRLSTSQKVMYSYTVNTTIVEERLQMSNLRIADELESNHKELAELQTCREKLEHQYHTVTKVLRQDMSDLQTENAAQHGQIELLKREMKCLQLELARSLEEHKQTFDHRAIILAENAAQHSQIESLKREMKCLQFELARSSEEHKQTLDHRARILDKLQIKCEELSEVKTSRDNLDKMYSTLKKELQNLKENLIPDNDTTIQEILRQNSALRDDLKSKRKVLVDLHTCKMKLEQQCLNMGKELQHFKDEQIPEKDKIIKEIKQQNSNLQDDLKSKREELAKLHTRKMKLEQQCLNMGKELQHFEDEQIPKKDKIIKEIQQQYSNLKDDLKSKREELVELHMVKMKLEQQCLNMGKELQHFKDEQIPKKDKIIKEIQQQNSKLQVDLRNKRNELTALSKTRENLEQSCHALLTKLKHLREEVIPEKDRLNERIQQQNSNVQTELQSKSTKLTESQTYRDNLKQRCHKMWTEVRHLEGEVIPRKDAITDRIREQNTGLQYDLHRRHKEVIELQQFKKYLEQEGHTLRTELRHLKEEVIPNKDITIGKIRLEQSRYLAIIRLLVFFLCLGFCYCVLGTWPFWLGGLVASLYCLFNMSLR